MKNIIKYQVVFVILFLFVFATLAFSAVTPVGRQLSERYSGTSFNFEIESNNSSIGRLEIVVHLSSATADPTFNLEIETVGTAGPYPNADLTIDAPYAPIGEDQVRVVRTGAVGNHDRFSISIILLSYYDPNACTTGPNFHKKIRVSMGNLAIGGHLQAYVHSDEGVLISGGCDLQPSFTDPASFIKDLPIGSSPKPIDVILVLDVSGSMDDPASTVAGAPQKIAILHEASQLFLNTWASTGLFQANDRIGVVFFSTTAMPYLDAGPFLVPFTANPTTDPAWVNINNEVHTRPTDDMTAMGDGLQEALNQFDNNSDNLRHIILFTNGMQNEGNLVEDSGPTEHYKMLNGKRLRSYGIPIYTIGTGVTTGSPYEELLKAIAVQTGTQSKFTNNIGTDLTPAYFTNLVTMLRGNSPEIIAINSDVINKGQQQITHHYQVNRSGKRGIFVVSWHAFDNADRNPQALAMEVVGPGTVGKVTQGVVVRDGTHFHIQEIRFPLNGFPTNAHEGVWEIRIKENLQGASAYYHAALIVDEAQFHYSVGAAPRDYGTGEDILLTASLAVDNRPIPDADLIQAKVTHPRLPLGSFLHQHNLSDFDLNNNPQGVHEDNFPNRYSRKLYRLITEKNLGHLLEPIEDSAPVKLFDDGDKDAHGDAVEGDGIYSALYKNTKFPGQYRFDFTIEGEHPIVGKYTRSEKSEVMVRVKTLDPRESEISHDDLGGGKYLITFIPADRFKNFLGPGYAESIKIISSAGDVLPVEDKRENGTYTAHLSKVPEDTDPIVTISMHGETLIEKPLSQLFPSKRWSLGVYGIRNLPHKTLDKSYDSGYGFDVFLEYLLSSRFSAVAEIGYNGFSAKLSGVDDLKIVNLSGYLEFYPVIGTFQFAFFGGPGFYFLDPGDDKFGLHGGTVAEWRITSSFSLEGKYTYNYILTSGARSAFSAFNAGVRYRF